MHELLDEIRAELRPDEDSLERVEAMRDRINGSLEEADLDATCTIGGSFAKDTHLADDHDVVFPRTTRATS